LGKPSDKIIMDNPETLAKLVTQDISLIMIDTDSIGRCKSNYQLPYDLENTDMSECVGV
jgi:hypothetical protein